MHPLLTFTKEVYGEVAWAVRHEQDKASKNIIHTSLVVVFWTIPKSEKEKKMMDRVPYVSLVGHLIFAMVCTRPDIA